MKISVTGLMAQVVNAPVLTSGRVGQGVEFIFDEGWEGLTKTAVFRCGNVSLPVLCRNNSAVIPWEVLEKPGCTLYVGVYGTDEQGTVMPTVWAEAGKVEKGTTVPAQTPKEHTPDAYCQILEIANSVREDASSGKFNPVRGVDYWTEEDKEELVDLVLEALPVYTGEAVEV